MKLASYKDGSRDGQLVVVARDLASAHYATCAAQTLRQALDDWHFIAPQLQDLYVALNQGRARHAFPFDPARCMAPLPRACQWAVGAAFPAAGAAAEAGDSGWPPLRQGTGDAFLGPRDELMLHDEALTPDFGACLAVVSDDLAARSSPAQALAAIRLLLLANDWCLRAPAAAEAQGAVSAWPGTAFAPVALTPDELGPAWEQGRPKLTVAVMCNGQPIGRCDAGTTTLHFGQLLAQLCRTRALGAGTVLGCGPLVQGLALTAGPTPGDRVRIEAQGRDGQSLFGAIEQTVTQPG
jgi:fumarylacetoacetate (FAA) hydrolase